MPLLTILILAIIQGITEFLPISSSGHLVLAEHFMGANQTEMWATHESLNIAVHLGTLFSVLLYYRKDVVTMLTGLGNLVKGNTNSEGAKLNIYLLIGSIPVIAAGLVLHELEPDWLLSVKIIGWTTLIFGIALWIIDLKAPQGKELKDMSLCDSILIGLAQAIALIPGTSRSGITMTAARALGYSRTESAHFSLLLAIIAITGAGSLGLLELWQKGSLDLGIEFLTAAVMSFVTGYISIALMMKWLEKCTFAAFGFYRVVLGLVLLYIVYMG